jgi:CheY-like chemotaxis protein/LmbE family N-acetylglucosaminyl deacetylase
VTRRSRSLRVLFAEDAFDQSLMVRSFLRDAGGYEVVHCQDGDHAVRLLESEPWDLVVTDLNLPGKDGFEVIRVATRRHPDIPVLAITGYTSASYQEQAFRAGATDLLHKPLEKAEFLDRLDQLLGARSSAREATGILAIGGLMGDVEMGCGGTLLGAREPGREILIVPLCFQEGEDTDVALAGARAAAELLGAQLLVEREAMRDTRGRVSLVELAVRDLDPGTVYLPAMDESHPARREAFRIGKAATTEVPRVLGYQTATTGLDFRPTRFEDVARQMVLKMEALAAYQTAGAGRLDLAPRMAQAYARYWGRFQQFGEHEAFEVIREGQP